MNRFIDTSTVLLILVTGFIAVVVALKDSALLTAALQKSGRLLAGVWIEILFGFILAGLVEVLVPQAALIKWLGEQHVGYGILAGWGLGLLLPGGPYLLFPLAANLMRQGAAPGPLIALLTAKVLLSPIRMVSYEVPLLGWSMTLARVIPSLIAPPAIAFLGQWLFSILRK